MYYDIEKRDKKSKFSWNFVYISIIEVAPIFYISLGLLIDRKE